ncbi:MAG: 4Fe-4S dicluster domain-containing protein [bacterium]|nr:4Fe-4S dicluster domain-containing protein [bacterium]
MSDKTFLVDTTKCSGCRGCQVACKEWNGLPGQETKGFEGTEYTNPAELSAITWNHVKFSKLEKVGTDRPVWNIMHKKCYHCEEANCVRVCPQKAISKVDGWTIIDQAKCIGCGACESSCVYAVPYVSEKKIVNDMGADIVQKGKAHKCNVCTFTSRDIPACVTTCPTGALSFGHRPALLKQAKERVKKVVGKYPEVNIYGEKEFGGLRVLTILKTRPKTFDLPQGKDAVAIDMAKAEAIKDTYALLSSFTFGIPSLNRMAYKMSRSLTKDV